MTQRLASRTSHYPTHAQATQNVYLSLLPGLGLDRETGPYIEYSNKLLPGQPTRWLYCRIAVLKYFVKIK